MEFHGALVISTKKKPTLINGRWAAGVGLVTVVALGMYARWRYGPFDAAEMVRQLQAGGAQWWAVPLYVVAFLAGTALLLPGVAFFAVAGATWGFGKGFFWAWVMANVAAHLHFGVGRLLGRDAVEAFLERRGWSALTRELKGHGLMSVVIVRQLPLPFLGVNVALGASPVRWRDFLFGNALGVVPNCVMYSYFAAAVIAGAEAERTQLMIKATLIAVGVLSFTLVTRWWAGRGRRSA